MSYKIVAICGCGPHDDAKFQKVFMLLQNAVGLMQIQTVEDQIMRAVLNAAPMPTPFVDGGLWWLWSRLRGTS